MAFQTARSNNSSFKHRCVHPADRAKTLDWQEGEVAFLKHHSEFSPKDHAAYIQTDIVYDGATNHPVIILEKSDDGRHYLVTTVSGYSSGAANNYLAPWKQACHRNKNAKDFRAFVGSEKPTKRQKHLQLEDGQMWPKPKTSWTYIQRQFVVPTTVLKYFDKSPCLLRVTKDSLEDLISHMKARCRQYSNHWTDARLIDNPVRMASQARTWVAREPKRPMHDTTRRPSLRSESFDTVLSDSSSGVSKLGWKSTSTSSPSTLASSRSTSPAQTAKPVITPAVPTMAAIHSLSWSAAAASKPAAGPWTPAKPVTPVTTVTKSAANGQAKPHQPLQRRPVFATKPAVPRPQRSAIVAGTPSKPLWSTIAAMKPIKT